MIDCQQKKVSFRLVFITGLLLALSGVARSEQLPVKIYTLADGLAHDEVNKIVQDSHGFLWFCTNDGLSRFDGYRFTNYGVKDGLPSATVLDLLESRRGIYWVATKSGLSIFNPLASSRHDNAQGSANSLAADDKRVANDRLFNAYSVGDNFQASIVLVLYEDRAGNLWAGTQGGLFRLEDGNPKGAFQRIELGVRERSDEVLEVPSLLEDREGSLWIGTLQGLVRRLPDGRVLHYSLRPQSATDYIRAILEDKDGRLWLGHQFGLHVFQPEPAASVVTSGSIFWHGPQERKDSANARKDNDDLRPLNTTGEGQWFTTADGLAHNTITALQQTADGRIWIGASGGGLTVFDGERFRGYATAQGISKKVNALAEDKDNNLWVGTQTSGAIKVSRSGFLSYGEADGLGNASVVSIFENLGGELCVIGAKWTINRFDGEKFASVRPNLPQSIIDSSSGRWVIIEDHAGEWWVATNAGLYRFARVRQLEELAHAQPLAVYTTRDGLADNNISRLIEDASGDIWISSYNPPVMLTRWERSTRTFHRYAEADGLPTFNWANVFGIDAGGNLWIGLHNGGLARYRGGRFELIGKDDGVPFGLTQGFYFDHAHRLWIATSVGAARLDEPTAERPRAAPLTLAGELASNNINCFTEDEMDHVYAGTARGIDQLDPASGRVKHYTTADGLIKSEVVAALRDRGGTLWFGTREGVSRMLPQPEFSQAAPPVQIGSVRVAGVSQPVSELGETEVSGLVLDASQNQIQIDFFGISFSAGAGLRYQYMLEGVSREWSAPTDQRTVTVSLSPGSYLFRVRAVTADGISSAKPAIVSFTILPPLWQRWWFLTLAALLVTAAVYSIFRYRLGRAIELERVRTRIATDLHDDIGASLSQIAILSEVANQRAGANGSRVSEPLQMIAGTSREMVDAMSDIVWAINPQKDHLSDLSQRMRRFASDILSARDITFRFRAPGADEQKIRLGADMRREIYLIFKESVNNLAKHSRCTEADLLFQIKGDSLTITVSDNGAGFDVEQAMNGNHNGMGGHGLSSLRRRAEALGGTYEVKSAKGAGTTVSLVVPLGHRRAAAAFKKLLPKQVVTRKR